MSSGKFLFVIFCSSAGKTPTHAAVDLTVSRKEAKYAGHADSYIFQPIAIESHGELSSSFKCPFLSDCRHTAIQFV